MSAQLFAHLPKLYCQVMYAGTCVIYPHKSSCSARVQPLVGRALGDASHLAVAKDG